MPFGSRVTMGEQGAQERTNLGPAASAVGLWGSGVPIDNAWALRNNFNGEITKQASLHSELPSRFPLSCKRTCDSEEHQANSQAAVGEGRPHFLAHLRAANAS